MKKIAVLSLFFTLAITLSAQTIQVFPHTEDFESFTTCGTVCGNSCTLPLTSFWINDPSTDGMDWTVDEGGTPSSSTGPSVDHNPGTGTGNYLYMESSGSCGSATAHLISPFLDFTTLQNPTMDFWYHMYGTNMGTMHVDVSLDSGATWILNVEPGFTDNVDLWQKKTVSLSAFAGDIVNIRIRGVAGGGFRSDMAVDDFRFYEQPAVDLSVSSLISPVEGCGLGMDTVCLEITNFGVDTLFPGDTIFAAYQLDTNTVVSESIIVTDTLFGGGGVGVFCFSTLVNLSQVGSYSLTTYTQQPADGNMSNDTISGSLRNYNVNSTYPYFDNLESGDGDWSMGGSNSTWAFGTPVKSVIIGAASGANAFVTGGLGTGDYNNNEASFVENLNCFDFTNQPDLWLAASVWWNAEFSWDGAIVQYSTDGGITWLTLGSDGDPNNWYTDNTILGVSNAGWGDDGWTGRASTANGSGGWLTAKYDLSFLNNAGEVRFRFAFGSDGSVTDDGFAFDNFVIAPLPPKPDLGPDSLVCDSAYWLDATVSVPGTYLWSTGDTTNTLSVNADGTYIVTFTDTLGLCTMDTVTIDLLNTFYPNIGPDTVLCLPGTRMLDAGTDSTVVSYLWSTGDTVQTIGVGASGTYSVTVTTDEGCVKSDSALITAVSTPTVNLGPDTLVCGEAYTLDAGTPGATWLWSTGDTTRLLTVVVPGANTYTVDLSTCGSTVSDTVVVDIHLPPVVNLGADTTGCDAITLDAGAWTTYSWSTGGMAQTEVVTTSGTVFVDITDAAGCPGSDTVGVTINISPSIVVMPGDTVACQGDTLTLAVMNPDSSGSFLWSSGGTGSSIMVSTAGTYVVTFTDSNSCAGTDTTVVDFITAPGIAISVDTTNCPTFDFLSNTTGVASAWSWDFGDGTGTSTVENPSYTFSSNSTYSVVLNASNQCGTTTDSVSVTVACIAGLVDELPSGSVSLYPNPNNGQFSLDFAGMNGEPVKVEVADMFGRTVLSRDFGVLQGNSTGQLALDAAAGVYFVKIQVGAHMLVRRMDVK